MAYLTILQPDARAAARLSSALRGVHDVVVCEDWPALERATTDGAVDGCIVDGEYPDRETALRLLQGLRRRLPRLAIVAYVDLSRRPTDAFRLGVAGIHGIIVPDHALRASRIREAVEQALAAALTSTVRAALEGRLCPLHLDCLSWAIEHATDAPRVGDLAAAMHSTPSSLGGKLRRADGVTPRDVLLDARLLRAAAMLAREGRTVEATAYRLGYSSGSALARAMRTRTGMSPSDVAARGGVAPVLAALFPRRSRRRGDTRLLKASWQAVALLLLVGAPSACSVPGTGEPGIDRRAIDAAIGRAPLVRNVLDEVVRGMVR